MFLIGRLFKLFSKTAVCNPQPTVINYDSCPKTIESICRLYLTIEHPDPKQRTLFAETITPLVRCENDCKEVIEYLQNDKALGIILFEKQTLQKIRSDFTIFRTIIKTG